MFSPWNRNSSVNSVYPCSTLEMKKDENLRKNAKNCHFFGTFRYFFCNMGNTIVSHLNLFHGDNICGQFRTINIVPGLIPFFWESPPIGPFFREFWYFRNYGPLIQYLSTQIDPLILKDLTMDIFRPWELICVSSLFLYGLKKPPKLRIVNFTIKS